MAFLDDLTTLETRETELVNNKVSRFAYTAEAYANNDASGVETYDPEADNNIPIAVASVMRVNDTIIDKGWRAQASSLTRMLMNHFLGRTSYNLNKVNDNFKDFLTSLKGSLGTASGIATLNADGKLNLSQFTPMTEITWDSLKSLRDDRELVAGHYYRITDYVTTTVQADTQSAGHAFDVIVRADSASVLNENAFAIQHEGDAYFASSNLSAWKLKYCLDNDTTRFEWADSTNGKGVIYRMVDEFDNDLPYDFKNIQFKRWGVASYLVNNSKWGAFVGILNSLISSVPSLRWGLPVYESAEEAIDDNDSQWWQGTGSAYTLQSSAMGQWKVDSEYDLFIVSNDSSKWFYTFSGFTSDSATITDSSLSGGIHNNRFGSWFTSNKLSLSNNVFIGASINYNTVGNNFNYNTVGNNFNYNTVGNNFYYNTVGDNFYYNTVGNDFNYNTVGNNFNYNTVGNYFNFNMVGNNFYYNTVGNYFNSNTVGNYFYSNTVGNYFNFNTVGNNFYYNTVGNYFYSNTVGNYFYSNTVGNNFYYNTVGNYYKWIHAEDGCQNLNFSTNGTMSSCVQKYRVLAGTAPLSRQMVSVTAGNTIPYNIKQTGANTIDVVAV